MPIIQSDGIGPMAQFSSTHVHTFHVCFPHQPAAINMLSSLAEILFTRAAQVPPCIHVTAWTEISAHNNSLHLRQLQLHKLGLAYNPITFRTLQSGSLQQPSNAIWVLSHEPSIFA